MLEPQELESIYELLHSADESNVEIALTIIKNRKDVKTVFDRGLELTIEDFKKETNEIVREILLASVTYFDIQLKELISSIEVC